MENPTRDQIDRFRQFQAGQEHERRGSLRLAAAAYRRAGAQKTLALLEAQIAADAAESACANVNRRFMMGGRRHV